MPSPKRRQKPLLTERAIEAKAEDLRLYIQASVSPFKNDTQAKREARIERARTDREYFARTYFPHICTEPSPDFHHVLDEAAQKRRSAVEVFRGGAKSTRVVTFRYIHAIVFKTINYAQYFADTDDQAELKLDAIKAELEVNKRLHNDFDIEPGHTWRKDRIICNDVCVDAMGLGSAVRGLTDHKGRRPDLITVDDPDNDIKVESAAQRNKLRKILLGAVIPGMNPLNGSLTVIGTSIHPECMIEWIMEDDRFRDWHRVDIPVIDPITGESAWPQRFTPEYLDELRRILGPAVFSAEMLNQPIDPDTAEISEDDIVYFSDADLKRADVIATLGALDPSLGKSAKSDFQAIIAGHVVKLSNGDVEQWIRLADLVRLPLPKLIAKVFSLHVIYRFQAFGIETVAFQDALRQWIDETAKKLGVLLNIEPVKNSGGDAGKTVRIRGTLGFYKRGRIRLHESLRGSEFVRQLLRFPRGHDDGPDAAEMWLRLCARYGAGDNAVPSAAGRNYMRSRLEAQYYDTATPLEMY